MKKQYLTKIVSILFILILLTSCSSLGLMSDKSSWLPHEIYSFGDFLEVYLILQVSMIIVSFFISIFFGGGRIVSVIAHFIWIIIYRDYSFWILLLLFGIPPIIRFIFFIIKNRFKIYNNS